MAGFDSAPVYDRLPKLSHAECAGTYVAEIKDVVEFASAQDEDQKYFKVVVRILEAAPGSSLAVGDEACELEQLTGKHAKSAFGRVKSIIGAIVDERGSAITLQDYEEAVAPDSPVRGEKVKIFASKKPANPQYNNVAWSHYRGPAATT